MPPCWFARTRYWVLTFFVTLHAAYIKCGAKERDLRSQIQNKMTSCEDFFSRLRKLAVTVDKESNELKGILENSEISSYNENRACVLLRETLAEVKNCKVSLHLAIYWKAIWSLRTKFGAECCCLVHQLYWETWKKNMTLLFKFVNTIRLFVSN